MNTVTKKRFLVGTIVILIVINISALSTMAFNKYQRTKNIELKDNNNQYNRGDKRQKTYHTKVKNFVKHKLSLSEEQYEQYVKLKDINIEKSNRIMQEIGDRKRLIFKAYCEETQDTVVLNKMADETGNLHAQMQKETLRHFQEVEKVLTPEQLVKFKFMLCNMSNRRGHGQYQRGRKRQQGINSEN